MLIFYRRPSQNEMEKTVSKIAAWFEKNPKRRICWAQLWDGRTHRIRKSTACFDVKNYEKN